MKLLPALIPAFLLALSLASCNTHKQSKTAERIVDSCLYKGLVKHSQVANIRLEEVKWSINPDTGEVSFSLGKLYYDTAMNRFTQCIKLEALTDSFGKITLSEYILDSNYYRTIQHKFGGGWAAAKIEGVFMFRDDSSEVHKPNTVILKGPPGILIATSEDTDNWDRKFKYLLGISPYINDCRGTAQW
jgi:hypothetical protein